MPNNIAIPNNAKAETRTQTGHIRRKKKSPRSRLSYLLLDVFLGGFMVGVVLVTTLGRPEAQNEAIGSGGEAFMLIEYSWDQEGIIFTPLLHHEGKSINQFGMASPWSDPGYQTPWLAHDPLTGLLEVSARNKPFDLLAMDGFHLDAKKAIYHDKKRYGYIWISEPCAGTWEFGLRIVSETMEQNDSEGYTVNYRISWSGYSGKQKKPQEFSQIMVKSNNNEATGNVTGVLTVKSQGSSNFLKEVIPFPKKPFTHCSQT